MVTRRKLFVGMAAASGLSAVGVGTGAAAATVERAAATAQARGAALGFPLPGGLTCPVPYLSRAAWGADESWRFTNGGEDWPIELHPAQALTVHHTGFAASADAAETVRTIYRQQALTQARGGIQGWGDIGYNLLIDAAGVVYQGRYSGSSYPVFGPADRLMSTGAHVLYYNTGNIGVCLLGYLTDQPPTQAAQDSLVTVLAYLAAVVGVNPQGAVSYYNPVARPDGTHSTGSVVGVSGHRNWAATECPGNALYPLLDGIRQRTAAAMPSVQPPSTQPPPTQPPPTQPPPTTDPPATQTTGTSGPTPSGTTTPTQTAGTTPTPTPTPTPDPPQTGGGATQPPPSSPGRERGGDEYVAAARVASPSEFPTVAPEPTSTVDATPTDGLTSAGPSWSGTVSWTIPPGARTTSAANNPTWGIAGGAVGLAVVGALGWVWQRRRNAASALTPTEPTSSTVDTAPPVPRPVVEPTSQAAPAPVQEPAPSPVEEIATGPSAPDEPTTEPSAVDEPTE